MVALAVPMGVGRFAFTPILPMMQVDAGLSIAAGAWLASANYLGTLIGALAATAVRVPIQPAVRGGLVTIGLATLAMGLERRVPAWIALRLIAGIATGWVLPFASAWALERLAPLRRPLLNAAVFAGFGVGIAAAGGVCIVLMHGRASSAQAWLSLGLVSLAATAVVWRSFVGRDVRSEASRRTGTGRWDTDAMLLVACYGSFGFGYIVPATFLPVMARAAIDDPSVFGWAWPVFCVAAAAHRLHDRDHVARFHGPLEAREPARVVLVVEAQHVTAELAALVEEVHAQLGMAGDQRVEGGGQGVGLDRRLERAADQTGEQARQPHGDVGHGVAATR